MSSDPATKGPRRSIRIGKYEVLSHIATGGMGAVYKARDTENGREVALKVLSPEMASKPGMLERFRREAKHALKLRHENIVTLHECGEANHTYYLVMEFIDGDDLHEYSNRKGPLDPAEALQIILQACRALAHAYEQGIVHRDIKPSNFLVARKGDELLVKMTDLGLARECRDEEFRVTKAGTTVGTLDYMSPEQARDSGLADIRSDLYSLGSTWYHLLAGHAPFPKGGLGERLNRIMNEEPPDVRKFNPRVSEPTLAVLRRLMAKRPEDRYQKPADLLRDLERLAKGGPILSPQELLANLAMEEGETAPPPSSRTIKKPRRSSEGRRTPSAIRNRSRADTDVGKSTVEAPLPEEVEPSRSPFRLILAGATAILLLVALIVVVLLHRSPKEDQSERDTASVTSARNETFVAPPIVPANPPPTPIPVPIKGPDQGTSVNPAPKKPKWPALYHPSAAIDVAALRKEIEAPWAAAPKPGPTIELTVGRLPPDNSGKNYRSLSAACKAIPAGATGIIELRDNGPFYDGPAALADRNLVLRAAAGFRPLLVWDVQRTLDERRRNRERGQPADTAGPLSFLDVKHGNLTLEGLHVALKWPEAPSEGAALLRVEDCDLTVTGCTFSVAGKPRDGVTLARLSATKPEAGRCRLSNCYARGAGLSILDLNAPGASVLLENCLLVGGEVPLLQVRAGEGRPTSVRAVRSTMICGKNLLTLRPTKTAELDPAFQWLGWDVLLGRNSNEAGGELLHLEGGASTRKVTWRAINCLYAGWETLLAGSPSVPASDIAGWRRVWGRVDGDVAQAEPWPTASFAEPAEVPPGSYHTNDSPVAFAASTDGDRLLGCDPDGLPPVRDNWLPLTFGRFALVAPAVPDDPGLPEIPPPNGLAYQGEALNLDNLDLGAYLQNIQATRRLGPQVVLHLSGSGERFTTPFRIKGSNLVLYFEPPKEKQEPLALVPAGKGSDDAFIEVEQGNLDIIGGTLRITDAREARVVPWLIKMRGGDVRLFRTHLEVSPKNGGSAFRGLIALDGSGDAAPERSRACAVNESVLLSAHEGVRVQGIGARVLLSQSLVVAGGDAVQLALDPGFTGRANVQCSFDHATVAARGSVLHVPDVSSASPPAEPVVVQTHNCAFLNPFVTRGSRPGLVLYDGAALARGLLIWQSDSDAFDRRLWFASAPATGPLPDKPEDHASWPALWGMPALRHPTLDLFVLRTLDAERWPLDKFAGLKIPGANLERLGLNRTTTKKTPR
jgi:serine/threonine-protein kinase